MTDISNSHPGSDRRRKADQASLYELKPHRTRHTSGQTSEEGERWQALRHTIGHRMLVSNIRTFIITAVIMIGFLLLAISVADRIWRLKEGRRASGGVTPTPAADNQHAPSRDTAPPPGRTPANPATELDPEKLRKAIFLNRSAEALQKAGNLKEAAQRYQEALEVWPYLVDAWAQLGRVFLRLQEFDSAIRALERAVESDPSNPALLNDLGVAYLYRNHIPMAAEFFRAAVDISPDYAPALFNLVLCSLATEDIERACEYLDAYLRMRPDDPRALKEKAYLQAREGKHREALATLKKAIIHNPEWTPLYFDAAAAAALLGSTEDAIRYLEKAELLTTPREVYRVYLQPAFQQVRLTELGQLFERELAERARSVLAEKETSRMEQAVLPIISSESHASGTAG
ncbi:MAG TPA: tetratricopeptide repeat protein, partial [Kiritimatiellae bacterium]|nr:tetratricopeptide repeat protein [Kiritimatiellia bacterium]